MLKIKKLIDCYLLRRNTVCNNGVFLLNSIKKNLSFTAKFWYINFILNEKIFFNLNKILQLKKNLFKKKINDFILHTDEQNSYKIIFIKNQNMYIYSVFLINLSFNI